MPDEMKGDRSYHEILRRMGVKNIGELHVQNPVVMTAHVDDLSEIHAPLGNNLYHSYLTIGANAGQRSGAYLVSAGCWVKNVTFRVHYEFWTVDGTPPVLLNEIQSIPRLFGGEGSLANQRSTVHIARDVLGAWAQPATFIPTFAVGTTYAKEFLRGNPALYLPPGRVLYMTVNADNEPFYANIEWTELPPAPPGG